MIVRWAHTLVQEPDSVLLPGVSLRCYRDESDIPRWLGLREAALTGLAAPGRPWSEREFRREFLGQPWWTPERMLLAEDSNTASLLGAVALRPVTDPVSQTPAEGILWLLVAPPAQRRGLGRLLLREAERSCWSGGTRLMTLETLATWSAAMGFYAACGYVRSPQVSEDEKRGRPEASSS